jgi:hypothetical protein
MAGRPGRSGGHNRISLAEHVLRGTFNATRHGRRQAALNGPPWSPTKAQLQALGPNGRGLLERLAAVYVLGVLEGELALEAAVVADRLAELRDSRRTGDLALRLKLDKTEQLWQRQFSSLLLALKVEL